MFKLLEIKFSLLLLWGLIFSPTALAVVAEKKNDQEITVEEFLQKLSSVPNVLGRRDPFEKQRPPFEFMRPDSQMALNIPILQRFPAQAYQVVAILVGDIYSRGLVRLPDSSKIMIVREKDKLGNRNGVIKKILKDGLIVEETKKNDAGFVDRNEVLLSLQVSGGSGGAPVGH